jgi:hypothetical protein
MSAGMALLEKSLDPRKLRQGRYASNLIAFGERGFRLRWLRECRLGPSI